MTMETPIFHVKSPIFKWHPSIFFHHPIITGSCLALALRCAQVQRLMEVQITGAPVAVHGYRESSSSQYPLVI